MSRDLPALIGEEDVKKLRQEAFDLPLWCLSFSISADEMLLGKLKAATLYSSGSSQLTSGFSAIDSLAVAKAALHPLTSAASQRQLHKLACGGFKKLAAIVDRAEQQIENVLTYGADLNWMQRRIMFGKTADGDKA